MLDHDDGDDDNNDGYNDNDDGDNDGDDDDDDVDCNDTTLRAHTLAVRCYTSNGRASQPSLYPCSRYFSLKKTAQCQISSSTNIIKHGYYTKTIDLTKYFPDLNTRAT
ncbi:hypothetical protein RIR_jg31378.t1 [Rhizophagus irregularis DAOM 181602=DAOM 197198]|uniref:Uncharacterized protein n=1 Tax=Rhizophagus irregularis (strain DAOM 181602 / DAOM 197198 / MUCL 43194) TaxID=747089 RepID=U9U2I9_RHIID|nr:hypothetical protein RhiirB3_442165 [Rhizophagus irregularis]GBC30883.1 hypothetical protein RIR_jg31378.t1 [Rhizophagus irregularis DAOM 181602=DAOM 197198]